MNKTFFFIVILLLINTISAYSIGYIVNNPEKLDNNEEIIKYFLLSEKHNVLVLDDTLTNVKDYDVIIVSESVSKINFDNKIHKTLFLSKIAAEASGLADNYGTTSNAWEININKIDFITDGYSKGVLRIYTSTDKVHYLSPSYASNSNNLAYYKAYRSKSVLLTLDKGSFLIDKNGKATIELLERNLFFGFSKAQRWNSDSKRLFLRSLHWLKSGGLIDNDNDGYYSIDSGGDDCDDADSDINPGSNDIMKNCKNDSPVINDFSPKISKFIKNKEVEFNVQVTDDQIVEINWEINGESISKGNTLKFNKDFGNYKVEAKITDGEITISKEWNIEVKDYNEFKCSDVKGNICSENYICNGEFHSTIDTPTCCMTQCSEKPPVFEDVNTCETKNNKIEINYNFNQNNYFIGDNIEFNIRLNNKFIKDQDFIVNGYLYDLTKKKILNSKKSSIKIGKLSTESINLDFKIPYDLKVDNEFVLYTHIKNNDNECNDKYERINIDRKDEQIIIKDLDFKDVKYSCGDYVEFEVQVNNLGKESKKMIIELKSDLLGIKETSDEFELEKYGEDNSDRKKFIIKIPEKIKAGNYIVIAEAQFNGNVESIEKKIIIEECKETIVKEEKINIINLIGKSLPLSNNEKTDNNVINYIILWLFTLIVVFSVVLLYYSLRKK